VLAARFLPLDHLPAICAFYHVTGRPCPTCGMTRAVIALAHLDFRRAMGFHPLSILLAAVVLLVWGMAVYEALTGRNSVLLTWAKRHTLKLTLSALGVLLVFGALRIAFS
jgi:hypothetical protein